MMKESNNGFTLIELLVVIGIIAVLAAILMPAINTAVKKGERVQAQADVKMLHSAWVKYYNEYGKWPNAVVAETPVLMNTEMVNILKGYAGTDNTDNPKRLPFMEFNKESINSSGAFVDPWMQAYRIKFDYGKDGHVSQVPGAKASTVYESVVAWSMGPDENESSTNDNIASWE